MLFNWVYFFVKINDQRHFSLYLQLKDKLEDAIKVMLKITLLEYEIINHIGIK